MPQNNNPQIGTFETDAVVRVPLLTHNNNKHIPLHDVFQGTHQVEKNYVQRRYAYLPVLMPKNKDGKYDISSSPARNPQKTRITIPILLEDEDFRNRVFEKIKQNANLIPNEQAFAIDTLDINNIQVRPVYNFEFTNFDHDGTEYPVFISETRNFLADTGGKYEIMLYMEVDNADAEYILRSPENIIIKCQYELNFVQQDRNRTSVSMSNITNSSIYANLKQEAKGKLIERKDVRKLLNTLTTEISIYTEMDRPQDYQATVNGLIDKIMGRFEERDQEMYQNANNFLQQELLSNKDFQPDVLTGETRISKDTHKETKEGGGTSGGFFSFIKKAVGAVANVINPVAAVIKVVDEVVDKVVDKVADKGANDTTSTKNSQANTSKESSEQITERTDTWTGEKLTSKDVVVVTDLLNAMESNLSLSHTSVVNTRGTGDNTSTIIFSNYDYTPKKETPLPPPPPPKPKNLNYTETQNNANIEMIWVEGGTFKMGGQDDEVQESEKPVHEVTVDSFYIGKYPVTQAQWVAVMGSNPSHFKGDNLPVEQVSWDDAMVFCNKLSSLTGKRYALPTEAEWEYAARGGNRSHGYKYAGSNDKQQYGFFARIRDLDLSQGYKYAGSNELNKVGWYSANSASKTWRVGLNKPNELGLYDMSGNVWEWCGDWYAADYYKNSPAKNPTGPASGTNRVLRGGSWDHYAQICRVAFRSISTPAYRFTSNGFRLALVP